MWKGVAGCGRVWQGVVGCAILWQGVECYAWVGVECFHGRVWNVFMAGCGISKDFEFQRISKDLLILAGCGQVW